MKNKIFLLIVLMVCFNKGLFSQSVGIGTLSPNASAQHMEHAAREPGYDFDGVNAPRNETDHYSISYASFVMPLVKAVQEQQTIIEQQQKQIDSLKKQNESILATIAKLIQTKQP